MHLERRCMIYLFIWHVESIHLERRCMIYLFIWPVESIHLDLSMFVDSLLISSH